jgi:hypothetical protein
MELEKALEWAKQQSVVQVRAFRENEEDKFTFTVGEYLISPLMFDTQEEAEKYLKNNFKLTNLELAAISAITHKINKLSEEELKNEGV